MGREREPGGVMQWGESDKEKLGLGRVSFEMKASSEHVFEMYMVSTKLCFSL